MTTLSETCAVLGPEYTATLLHSVTALAAAAQAKFGCAADTTELMSLNAVRDLVLGDVEMSTEEALTQLAEVPTFKAKLALRKNDAQARGMHAANMANMTRSERINYARQNPELASESNKSEQLSDSEFLRIAASLGPANRIAFARKHGRG